MKICTNKPIVISDNGTVDGGEVYRVNISGPDTTQWVLHDLETASYYKFDLRACTRVGCGPAVSEESLTATSARKFLLQSYTQRLD